MSISDEYNAVCEQNQLNRKLLREMAKELAEFQESEFHPDWSLLEATRRTVKELEAELAEGWAESEEYFDLDQKLNKEIIENKRLREVLANYGEHKSGCVLSLFQAGRPKETGGYEFKYAGKWYDTEALPKCECGLSEALEAK